MEPRIEADHLAALAGAIVKVEEVGFGGEEVVEDTNETRRLCWRDEKVKGFELIEACLNTSRTALRQVLDNLSKEAQVP